MYAVPGEKRKQYGTVRLPPLLARSTGRAPVTLLTHKTWVAFVLGSKRSIESERESSGLALASREPLRARG